MTEFITENPILALIVAIVPVAAVMWKVFHELYVKPRDFRIDLLKEDMARLSNQLGEFKKLREGSVVTGQGQGHGHGSSQIEARPTDLKPLEKSSLPIAQLTQGSKNPTDQVHGQAINWKPPEKDPLRFAQSTSGSKGPANSLAVFYERWSDPSITELQKQKFEQDWTGKDVHWVVSVDSVSKASHGNILVSVRDGPRDNYAAPRAMIVFSESHSGVLLSLQPGDPIVVTGKIREFFLGPMLDALTVERA